MTRSLISHDCYADTLRTIKRVPSFNIAAEIGNEEFIAHSSCQYLLNIRWSGRLILEEGNRFKVKYLLQQMVALIITLLFEICICFFCLFFIREATITISLIVLETWNQTIDWLEHPLKNIEVLLLCYWRCSKIHTMYIHMQQS